MSNFKTKITLILITLFCLNLSLCIAETREALTDVANKNIQRIDDILEEVIDTHPSILEMLKSYNSAVQDMEIVNGSFRPTIDFEADTGYEYVKNSTTRFNSNDAKVNGVGVTIKQLLFDGKRTSNYQSSKRASALAKLFGYISTVNRISFETLESYLNVLKYNRIMDLADENVEIHSKILKSITMRVKAGTSGSADLERVNGRLANAQSKQIVSKNNYKKSIYMLHKYLGRFTDSTELVLPGFNPEFLPANLKTAWKKQLVNHPTLLAAGYNIEQKKWEYRKAMRDYSPTLHLVASRRWQSDYSGVNGDDDDTRVLLKARYRAYEGGARKARLGKTRSNIHKEKQARDRIKRSLLNDLQLTWSGYEVLQSQLGAIKKSLIYTKKALDSYKEEFKLGKRNLINILDAENEYQTKRQLLKKVEYDLIIAKYRVLYSIGTLPYDMKINTALNQNLIDINWPRKAGKDTFPVNNDLDLDGVIDMQDISVNSSLDSIVDNNGGNSEKMLEYMDNPDKSQNQKNFVVNETTGLKSKKIGLDETMKIGFASFDYHSIVLSAKAKVMFRDLLTQLKELSLHGIVEITVHASEYEQWSTNYSLGLKRGYNIKKILATHDIDPGLIKVFSVPEEGGKVKNYIAVKVSTASKAQMGSLLDNLTKTIEFKNESSKIEGTMIPSLAGIARKIKTLGIKAADIIVYSNDYSFPNENTKISALRAREIFDYLKESGVDCKKIVPIGWGAFKEEIKLDESEKSILNYVKIITRKE